MSAARPTELGKSPKQPSHLATPMIDIVNRQRRRKISQKHWRDFGARAVEAIGNHKAATIVFVSDSAIRKLNKQFRGKDYVTDVLSFLTEPEQFENESSLGEIVIATDRAGTQAKENGLTFQNEIEQLVLHGLLHLCGYDHETDNGEMNRLELKLRKKLGI
jgi:probable rRNA maturation factor